MFEIVAAGVLYVAVGFALGEWFAELFANEADEPVGGWHRVVGYVVAAVWPLGVLAVTVGWMARAVLSYLAYSPVGRHRRQ